MKKVLFTLIISTFLIVNFQFSTNSRVEKYSFHNRYQKSKNGTYKTTLIILEDNKFDSDLAIRYINRLTEYQGLAHLAQCPCKKAQELVNDIAMLLLPNQALDACGDFTLRIHL